VAATPKAHRGGFGHPLAGHRGGSATLLLLLFFFSLSLSLSLSLLKKKSFLVNTYFIFFNFLTIF
jgi:hypothetical protein